MSIKRTIKVQNNVESNAPTKCYINVYNQTRETKRQIKIKYLDQARDTTVAYENTDEKLPPTMQTEVVTKWGTPDLSIRPGGGPR